MNRIGNLRADIVPHAHWAVSKWFYADPIWYYHRRGTDEELVAGRRFYELVDPELRELCRLLNEHGLHTTPSCQGHFYPKTRFEKIWAELGREAELVRGEGLVVKDSETQKEYLFCEGDYTLPWRTFEEFFAQAGEHQGMGYLGVLMPARDCGELTGLLRSAECDSSSLRMRFDPENGRALGGELFGIMVRPRTPTERARIWREVTDRFAGMLARHACARSFVPPPPPESRSDYAAGL